jgi:hypothetical protein
VVCGGSAELHHLLTRKAYPELQNESWNLIPVCRVTHQDFHAYGNSYMAIKHSQIELWFSSNGWEKIGKKWWPPSYTKIL